LAAVKKVSRYPDQKITLVDAIVAVLSEKMNLPVWSYDYHFDVMGIPVWR
jgi:predicted nucleic acid-binding protein